MINALERCDFWLSCSYPVFWSTVKSAAVVGVLWWLFSTPVMADGLPRGLGHPQDGSHWYDRQCCDDRDCEEVEAGAITRTPEGYKIKYRSSRGHVAEGFHPFNSTGIRPSQDGREHGCSYPSGRVPCIYLPAEM